MADYSKRRAARAYAIARLGAMAAGVLLLGALAVVSARAAWGMYGKFAEARQSSAVAQAELHSLREKEDRVRTSVETFSSTRGFEQEVRTRFGVAREGEGEIKIVRDAAETDVVAAERKGFWSRLFETLSFW